MKDDSLSKEFIYTHPRVETPWSVKASVLLYMYSVVDENLFPVFNPFF